MIEDVDRRAVVRDMNDVSSFGAEVAAEARSTKDIDGIDRRGRSPLVGRVFESLLARVRDGEFQLGQRLPGELELASLFMVSRPIVRDALHRLREEGIIYSRRGSGSYVCAVPEIRATPSVLGFAPVETIADIQRCYEFRITIEPDHAYWAALRWDREKLETIEVALNLMRDATRRHDHREDADFAFHSAIAEASNNHYYASSMAALKEHIGVGMKFHGLSIMGPGFSLEGVFEEHVGIFEAIHKRDAVKARLLMRSHLEGSRDRVFGGHTLDLAFR